MRFWMGVVTMVAGIALWFTARREQAAVPFWVPRLAIAVSILGAGTVTSTLQGLTWSYISIALSLVAIVLIVMVLVSIMRRR